jgi:hypothetical protein
VNDRIYLGGYDGSISVFDLIFDNGNHKFTLTNFLQVPGEALKIKQLGDAIYVAQ